MAVVRLDSITTPISFLQCAKGQGVVGNSTVIAGNSLFTIIKTGMQQGHSDLKCPITFGNWFWYLIVGNRSIVLTFYQKRPIFPLKNCPRPQRPKRPMKANKGQQSPRLQIYLLLSLFNVKSSINVNMILKKCVFKKSEIFIFIT